MLDARESELQYGNMGSIDVDRFRLNENTVHFFYDDLKGRTYTTGCGPDKAEKVEGTTSPT